MLQIQTSVISQLQTDLLPRQVLDSIIYVGGGEKTGGQAERMT